MTARILITAAIAVSSVVGGFFLGTYAAYKYCGGACCVRGDLTHSAGDLGRLASAFAPWLHDATACHFAGYAVTAPAKEPDGSVWLTIDRGPTVMIYKRSEIDITSLPDRDGTRRPALTLQDRNDDGVYDFVSYQTHDEHGNPIADVTDGNLDGEPDFKLLPNGAGALVRINGQWYPLQKQGEKPGVVIDGAWRQVHNTGPFQYALSE